jgi:hypothetical protein
MVRRIEALLQRLSGPSSEALRRLRAVQVLERADTAEARLLLQALADPASTKLAAEATAALQRLKQHSSK